MVLLRDVYNNYGSIATATTITQRGTCLPGYGDYSEYIGYVLKSVFPDVPAASFFPNTSLTASADGWMEFL